MTNQDPYCFCGNLVENIPSAGGNTGHMMDCPRYREIVYDEKPDPEKCLLRLHDKANYHAFEAMWRKMRLDRVAEEVKRLEDEEDGNLEELKAILAGPEGRRKNG